MIEAILSKLFASLNAIPADKVMHFASGTILYAALLPFVGSSLALSVIVMIAVAKEIYDSCNPDKHTADMWDAVATTLGGLLGVFISLI